METETFPGRDARVRLIGDANSFERVEPLLRRSLLMVGLVALGIGIGHHWAMWQASTANETAVTAQVMRAGPLLSPGP